MYGIIFTFKGDMQKVKMQTELIQCFTAFSLMTEVGNLSLLAEYNKDGCRSLMGKAVL